MALNDPLANALSVVLKAEMIGSSTCTIPISSLITQTLDVMKTEGYIGGVEKDATSRGSATVKLSGSVNNCGVVRPRYNVKIKDIEKFEKRYLPAKNMGVIIISTPQGIMTHRQAKEKKIGGKLLAYCY